MVEYLTKRELMSRWRCSRSTLDRRRQAGEIVDIEGGKRGPGRRAVLFRLEDVLHWEQCHQVEMALIGKKNGQGDHSSVE